MTKIQQLKQFLQHDIWSKDPDSLGPISKGCLWSLRRVVITIECFIQNNLSSYAAALTYSCILAAVPVLSIIFAIARGFGFGSIIEERFRDNLQANAELAENIFNFINHYLEHTHSGVFLGVGLLLLVYTVVMLTSNIETAFNTIWHVRSSRNISRKVLNYISIFMILPLLIVVTSGFSVFMLTIVDHLADYKVISSTMEFVIQYTPILLACFSFVALYKLMPNTHVRWRSVIIPGFLAGILFQLLQYFYIHYQLMLSSYNAIYGSFAALPLFMLWLQLSWYICLAGAQMSYAFQRSDEYLFAKDSEHLSRQDHDSLCLLIMAHISHRFQDGLPPFTVHELSKETELPHSLIQGLVDELTSVHLLSETPSENNNEVSYQPSMDIKRMTVNFIFQRLDNNGKGRLSQSWSKGNIKWKNILRIRSSFCSINGDTCITEV